MTDPLPNHRALERKREILAAAARVFRRRGVHGAGMRDIAGEAGMHVGNLYYYFASKQDLLAFCQQEGLAGLLALAGHLEALRLGAAETLYLLVVGHVELLNEGTPGALAHLEVEGLDGGRREAILARRGEYEAALRQRIHAGVREGVFRPGIDPKVAALALLGALNWTVKWFRPGAPAGGKSARAIGEEFAALLVRGLLAPGVELTPPNLALLDRRNG